MTTDYFKFHLKNINVVKKVAKKGGATRKLNISNSSPEGQRHGICATNTKCYHVANSVIIKREYFLKVRSNFNN